MSQAPNSPLLDLAQIDEATFQRLYAERIAPCFVSNEDDRQAAVASFKRRALIGGGVAVVTALAVGAWAHEAMPGFMTGLVLGVVALAVAYYPLSRLARRLKQQYCTAIAEAMGAQFSVGGFDPPALARVKTMRLLPSYQRSSFEDLFTGAHKGARFDLYEAHLEQRSTDSKGRTRYTTVFRGQIVRMQFPREFLGVTIVRRDAGIFNAFGGGEIEGRKLERVGLVASEFERAFEVWSTDQVEARYLLHPVMLERLIALESALRGKRIRCAFHNGEVLVAVEGGNLFEPGDLFKPLLDPARARRIVDEIAGVVKVMDQVLTAQAARPTA